MPTYEYRCENCDRDFSLKMTMAQREKDRVSCPECRQDRVSPQYASFYAKTSKKS